MNKSECGEDSTGCGLGSLIEMLSWNTSRLHQVQLSAVVFGVKALWAPGSSESAVAP